MVASSIFFRPQPGPPLGDAVLGNPRDDRCGMEYVESTFHMIRMVLETINSLEKVVLAYSLPVA